MEMLLSGRYNRRIKYYTLCIVAILVFLLYILQPNIGNSNYPSSVRTLNLAHDLFDITESDKHNRSSTAHSNGNILIIFWTTFFGQTPKISEGAQYKWPFYHVGRQCPVKCELTTRKHRIAEASAIVFHSRDINMEDMPPRAYDHLPWILQTHENPVFTPVLRDKTMMAKFNLFVSYRLDSDFPSPEFLKPSLELPLAFHRKTGMIVAVYSNCELLRTNYMIEMKKHVHIDFFGSCLRTHSFIKRTDDNQDRKLRKLIRKYKFTLVFPNADCDYYVTEKISNTLSAGSVPIWLGNDKVDKILKWGNLNHSVIKVKDYPSPKHLADYLHFLSQNETEYNKYLKWKYEGFQFPPGYYKSAIGQWWEGLPLYCRVCMRIAKDPKGHDGLPVEKCDARASHRLAQLIRT